ncbi:CxxC-x17-CxxC domain-containing protein [Nanoarchaeota archaeon]
MTKVTCSSCGVECEVPFKPSTNKPLFCNDCFAKNGKSTSKPSSRDLEEIKEKLNKIMKALKIE